MSAPQGRNNTVVEGYIAPLPLRALSLLISGLSPVTEKFELQNTSATAIIGEYINEDNPLLDLN